MVVSNTLQRDRGYIYLAVLNEWLDCREIEVIPSSIELYLAVLNEWLDYREIEVIPSSIE